MQIEFSTDYESFQLLPENRTLSNSHVNVFVKDPSFPNTFRFHPIIVDEKRNIIDGQHRYFAARHLKIPIYFMIQPGANLDTIKNYNVQQKSWLEKDYLSFYLKQKKTEYIYLASVLKAYRFKLGAALDVISYFEQMPRKQLYKRFRNGELRVMEKKKVTDFFEKLDTGFMNLRTYQDIEEYRHLNGKAYIRAFCDFYSQDQSKFERLMRNLYLVFTSLPLTNKISEAYQYLCKASVKKGTRYA